jgi:hypothetical protein
MSVFGSSLIFLGDYHLPPTGIAGRYTIHFGRMQIFFSGTSVIGFWAPGMHGVVLDSPEGITRSHVEMIKEYFEDDCDEVCQDALMTNLTDSYAREVFYLATRFAEYRLTHPRTPT